MKKIPQILILTGGLFIVFSFIVFFYIFAPVVNVEVNYSLNKPKNIKIKPIDKEFSIIIPKIGANSKIIANVNPFNAEDYQKALTRGVAHARGTSLPNEKGNIFLFSHSSVNIFEASKYNSIFYLLSKLERNDEIVIYYNQKEYRYHVVETKLVNPKDVSYLNSESNNNMLTLMTCWPAGTNYKRLLIIAK